MTIVRVKGFQIFIDRHGRMRCYHRKSRIPVDLSKSPLGSAEFFAECTRIAGMTTKASGPAKPGTLGRLITEYRSSPAFVDLAPGHAPTINAASTIWPQSQIRRW
jgi:hypothetical protein